MSIKFPLHKQFESPLCPTKGGFKSEDTGEFLHLHHKYSKSLSCAEDLNFPPKTVNNLFKLSARDSDLEYLCLKPPLTETCSCLQLYSNQK